MPQELPVPRSIYERAVLFDTSAFEAILNPSDKYHTDAINFHKKIRVSRYPLYSTNLTVAETQRRLLYNDSLGIEGATNFIHKVYNGLVRIIRPTKEDELRALEYIEKYSDQTITFTDAVSMAVMYRIGIRKVFTFDWHFTLLGFLCMPGSGFY